MNIGMDLLSFALGTAAAALLVTGGALLRGGSRAAARAASTMDLDASQRAVLGAVSSPRALIAMGSGVAAPTASARAYVPVSGVPVGSAPPHAGAPGSMPSATQHPSSAPPAASGHAAGPASPESSSLSLGAPSSSSGGATGSVPPTTGSSSAPPPAEAVQGSTQPRTLNLAPSSPRLNALMDADQAADAWLMAGLPWSEGDARPDTGGHDGATANLSREELERSLRIAEQALAVATAQLAEAAAEREVHRTDAGAMRQRLERQAEMSAAEAHRLSNDLEGERAKVAELERAAERDRTRVKELEDELVAARDIASKASASANVSASASASASVKGEPAAADIPESHQRALDDLQQRLDQALSERDAAKNRADAAERLMEGVRARSRELADELKTLKARIASGNA